jgi:hypothetical protein
MRFPPAIVRTRKIGPNFFFFSRLIAVGPTAILKILAGTLPLSADPGKVLFHNFDFNTVLPASKTTAVCNLPVSIQFE